MSVCKVKFGIFRITLFQSLKLWKSYSTKKPLIEERLLLIVPEERLELSRITPTASETATFTNFAIRAL